MYGYMPCNERLYILTLYIYHWRELFIMITIGLLNYIDHLVILILTILSELY